MYSVIQEGENYFFQTRSAALYVVKISRDKELLANEFPEGKLSNDFFEFSFNLVDGRVDSKDNQIAETIIQIAKSWQKVNNKILFFICSEHDRSGKARMKLFEDWAFRERDFVEFNHYRLIENDNVVSHIGTIVCYDYTYLEYFRGSADMVMSKLNQQK